MYKKWNKIEKFFGNSSGLPRPLFYWYLGMWIVWNIFKYINISGNGIIKLTILIKFSSSKNWFCFWLLLMTEFPNEISDYESLLYNCKKVNVLGDRLSFSKTQITIIDLKLKVSSFWKQTVKPRILPKNEWINSFLLVCDLFSFIFLENPRPIKKVLRLSDL